MELAVQDIVRATGGEYIGEEAGMRRVVTGFTWDSRTVKSDALFIAMPGMRVDGNDYISAAIQMRAGAVLCTKAPNDNTLAMAGEFTCPLIVVDDGIEALERLAGYWRDQLHAIVIGVTGSTGKTSTKEFLRSVLSQRFKTAATAGNQNNEIGVPATILSADMDTEVLIVELGMRGLHQIEHLCSFVKPAIGVITNVGVSHLELLGTRENIARAKAELLIALPQTGLAVLNADDSFTDMLKSYGMLDEHGVSVKSYGFAQDATVRASEPVFGKTACASFELLLDDAESVPVTLSMPGRHNVSNALAAACTGLYLGVTPQEVALGLEQAQSGKMRLEILHSKRGITIVHDAYNANPDSRPASLDTLISLACESRRIAVLGDMGELGDDEYQLHVDVGAYAARAGLDMLVCVGTLSVGIKAGALAADMDASKVKSFTGIEEAQEFLAKYLQEGDLILVKASRFMELERIVQGIME